MHAVYSWSTAVGNTAQSNDHHVIHPSQDSAQLDQESHPADDPPRKKSRQNIILHRPVIIIIIETGQTAG